MPFGTELIIILFMLAINAVFAAYEMALASVSRSTLAALVSQKKKGAEAAAFMKDRMEASLAVVQLGITLAGAIAAATGGAGIEETLAPFLMNSFGLSHLVSELIALAMLIIPLSCFTIVFAELVPKMFALGNKEWVCLKFSPLMKILSLIAYPIVRVFEQTVKKVIIVGRKKFEPAISKEELQGLHELRAAARLARASRLIGAREEGIVLSAASLSSRPIRDIMIPAPDISMINESSSLTDALLKAHLDMHTRFPVCAGEDDPQTIDGYVNFKDIVLALKMNPSDPTIRGIKRAIMKVHEATPISEALSRMMQGREHIALVVSEEKKTLGMITLEDIIEELVGEIEDEFDRLPSHVHPYGSAWIMGGGVPMKVVELKIDLKQLSGEFQEHTPTLAEWSARRLGRPPQGGDVIEGKNIMVTVRKLRRKKISEAVVSKRPASS